MLTVLDIFSGIGGFSLGLERTGGFRTVAFCEIDPFCRQVLRKHWPDVPIFEDVNKLRGEDVGSVDVIAGGFPCQRFSTASRGRRTAPDFWPEFKRLIREIRPRFIIAENVQQLPIKRAEHDCTELGYRAFHKRIGAHEGGADHTRDRWWAFAYTDDKSELRSAINAEVAKLPSLCRSLWGPENYARAIRVPDGAADRMDRFRALGNTVMPQKVQAIGRAVLESA